MCHLSGQMQTCRRPGWMYVATNWHLCPVYSLFQDLLSSQATIVFCCKLDNTTVGIKCEVLYLLCYACTSYYARVQHNAVCVLAKCSIAYSITNVVKEKLHTHTHTVLRPVARSIKQLSAASLPGIVDSVEHAATKHCLLFNDGA